MKKRVIGAVVVVLCLAGGAYAYRAMSARPDCPGKVVCPLTGETICADQCPVAEVPECCKVKVDG
ncbi:MAG: hypothetical protein EPO68_01055 [Planctomycetota bacterium]|nr:MAG: hypothetical protein EPO68_01055 [Planctomycetota bacterium]